LINLQIPPRDSTFQNRTENVISASRSKEAKGEHFSLLKGKMAHLVQTNNEKTALVHFRNVLSIDDT